MKKKILFFYTKLTEYFLAGIEELNKRDLEIHIVCFPVGKDAPYIYRKLNNVNIYQRLNFTKKELLNLAVKINPDLIIVSGWTEKTYLYIAHKFHKKNIPAVLFFDNQWHGNLKQQIACIIAPFVFKKTFSYAWIPGKSQFYYAQKLGFKKNKIYFNGLSADTNLFSYFYNSFASEKKENFPKNFLFAGRYIKEKGITLLWDAFIELQEESPSEWNLICVGAGKLFKNKKAHPKIKHLGFIQPKDLYSVIKNTGVFILPSNFEPWGIVVHEFAVAGYPMILSDKVGAGSFFLEPDENGFLFKADNKDSLKSAMKKIINTSDSELLKMSEKSRSLSEKLSPAKWSETIQKIMKNTMPDL